MSGDGNAPDLPSLGSTRVLYVMATEQEYTAHLRERIDPLITGVGPVEAAAALGAALAWYAATSAAPDLIVALGTARLRDP
jgi:adenosylhomocysteine nucleosidase